MKKEWIYIIVGVVAGILIILGGIFGGKYLRSNNHNEATYGVYNIALTGWDRLQRTEFQKTIPELNRLGPTFRLVENGQPHQVIVINSDGIGCKEDGPGSYSLMEDGTRRIVINPTCTQGNPELRTAFMHEVGHSLGMMHILRRAGDTADYITPTTSYGFAVMNPYITYADSEHDTATPTDEIQSLDIREFIRIRH